ncbi:MAG: MarR family transcriptional regulator [Bacteroidales bacterium]|jgi:predicted transcriptional regulator|nr:MarR family transcriptional regulator [Bacteroidales bacterium]
MAVLKKRDSSKLREQIDETGKILERFGITPMNGRIIALFTVTEGSELTFEEIVSFFGASKSVISNSLSYLLDRKLIDYKTYNHGRKRHFYLTDRFFTVYFRELVSAMTELRESLYKILSARSSGSPDVTSRMLKWIATANIFEKQIESAFEQMGKGY